MQVNLVDLAVGIIIGGAFGKIVFSLVNHIIMPPTGVMMEELDELRPAYPEGPLSVY